VARHPLGDHVVVLDDQNLRHRVNHAARAGCRRVIDR
jgi:hypothetical protein